VAAIFQKRNDSFHFILEHVITVFEKIQLQFRIVQIV
jgi:hypothetical protein